LNRGPRGLPNFVDVKMVRPALLNVSRNYVVDANALLVGTGRPTWDARIGDRLAAVRVAPLALAGAPADDSADFSVVSSMLVARPGDKLASGGSTCTANRLRRRSDRPTKRRRRSRRPLPVRHERYQSHVPSGSLQVNRRPDRRSPWTAGKPIPTELRVDAQLLRRELELDGAEVGS